MKALSPAEIEICNDYISRPESDRSRTPGAFPDQDGHAGEEKIERACRDPATYADKAYTPPSTIVSCDPGYQKAGR